MTRIRASSKPDGVPYQNGVSDTNSTEHNATAPEVMPIAIVGMACRFPGDATNPKGLFDMCCEARSAWSEIPKDRMNVEGFWHPDNTKSGCFNNRGGHFLTEDVGLFDAPFFKINASEAKTMDPQQRLLLESSYEALENGGIPLHTIGSEQVGVYVGFASSDYSQLIYKDLEMSSTYMATGLAPTLAANRISYFFDFKGPSVTLDTACSSSLIALHLACQSLRTGESSQAIVAGTHLVLSPDSMTAMSLLGLFSDDGRSYTYDHRSTGYGRGEGVACIVIKPLKDALEAGDNIRAVIRNSGANQDGRTAGITMPSQQAQKDLMHSVYSSAGIDPSETRYVSAHGTGTAIGDPIEAGAIASVFASGRSPEEPLIVGSVKTNIGHTEAASGLASLIKTVFVLESGIIPPNMNFEKANEQIPLEKWNLKIPTTLMTWPGLGVRRASVCNFGFGGANAHVILERYVNSSSTSGLKQQNGTNHQNGTSSLQNRFPGVLEGSRAYQNGMHEPKSLDADMQNGDSSYQNRVCKNQDRTTVSQNGTSTLHSETTKHANGIADFDLTMIHRETPRVYVLSAFEKISVGMQKKSLAEYLKARMELHEPELMQDLAFTLAQRRSLHTWRVAIPASSQADLIDSLEGDDFHPYRSSTPLRLGFLFTGQGAQWHAMGRELTRDYPIFASALQNADGILRKLGAKWSLLDELSKDVDSTLVSRAYISQPAVAAIQIALVLLMRSWNIKPVAVSGHSSGEIPAAFASGALSMESCLAIAYHRGTVAWTLEQNSSGQKGAMLAIRASSTEVEAILPEVKSGRVDIACYLSPSLVVASGDDSGIVELQKLLQPKDVITTKLRLNVAYHSHHMLAIGPDYAALLGQISHHESEHVEFWSSSRGCQVYTESLDSSYWVDNLVRPVKLAEAIQKMCFSARKGQFEDPVDILLEVGPHSSFDSPVKQILAANGKRGSRISYLSSLKRNKDATQTMLELAASLFKMGYDVDLSAVNFPKKQRQRNVLADLPPYPWAHDKRHWHEHRNSLAHRFRSFPRHDILGSLTPDSNPREPRWRNVLRVEEMPWLMDHKIYDECVFPFAGFISLTIQGAFQHAISRGIKVTDSTRYSLREITVHRSLVFPESTAVETTLTFRPYNEGTQMSSDLWDEFSVSSYTEGQGWSEHCRGLISIVQGDRELNVIDGQRNAQDETCLLEEWINKMMKDCSTPRDCSTAYDAWATGGLVFGPTYRNNYEATSCPGQSVAHLRIPDTAQCMPRNYQTDCIIHPATLDTILQCTVYALTQQDSSYRLEHLPVFMKSFTLSHGISNSPGDRLEMYTTASFGPGGKTHVGSITVLDPSKDSNIPVVQIEKYTGSALASQNKSNTEAEARQLTFGFQWLPHIDSLRPHQFQELFPLCSRDPQEKHITQALEQAAFFYMEHCLDGMTEISPDLLQEHHQNLYHFMEHQVALGKGKKSPSSAINLLDYGAKAEEEIYSLVKASGDTGEMITKMGEVLSKVLLQEVEPLAVLLEDDLIERHFSTNVGLNRSYDTAALYVDKLAHENPNTKIIEIGGGTGGASLPLLEVLGGVSERPPRFAQYTFTDISTGLFEKVQVKLKGWGDLVSYEKLNIEEDPIHQGFTAGSYDVVVAMDVLYCTSDLNRTLRHVRSLLKPGGKLVLSEFTSLRLSEAITFGTLPGWWLDPLRKDSGPFQTEGQWGDLLQETGFSGLDGGPTHVTDGVDDGHKVMFSTAMFEETAVYPKVSIILDELSNNVVSTDDLTSSLSSLTGCMPTVTSLAQLDSEDIEGKDDKYYIFLQFDRPALSNPTNDQFVALQKMFAAAKGVLWVIRGASFRSRAPDANMAVGLSRTIRSENAGIRLITLDLDHRKTLLDKDTSDVIVNIFKTAFSSNAPTSGFDVEFAERDGLVEVPRVVLDTEKDRIIMRETQTLMPELQPFVQKDRALQLRVRSPGTLDTIYFEDDERLAASLGDTMVEIQVKAAGMNFKDVMIGMGQLPYEDLGLECSGVITAVGKNVSGLVVGDRVSAMVGGCFSNYVRAESFTVQKIPDKMSFTIAASIIIIFTTAYYSLIDVANLKRGETVLIHAAAGGVGQAAIMLAQMLGAEVFVTVSSVEKKKLMTDIYHINEDHIFSSRETTFEKGIMRATNGKGVDVILNSVASDALRVTWNCLAPLGRFVEVGKKDLVQNTRLEMRKFVDMATFASVDLGVLVRHRAEIFRKTCSEVMELFRRGIVEPVSPITIYPMSGVETALRSMQKGKHMGKIVIEVQPEDQIQAMPAKLPTSLIRPDASYLITGGTGGLGRSTARWLVQEGARNIILVSRSGLTHENVRNLVQELAVVGAKIAVYRCDVSERDQLERVIHESAQSMPLIRGVIHGVMVLRDMMFERSTLEDYVAVVKPKVQGAWNLHDCLSKTDLDFFIMLSSISGIVGNPGQASYAAANTFLDAFASYRIQQGLPASSIDIGVMAEVGYVAENKDRQAQITSNAGDQIKENEYLALIKSAIYRELTTADYTQTITGCKMQPGGGGGAKKAWFSQDPIWSHLIRGLTTSSSSSALDIPDATNNINISHALKTATSPEEAATIISDAIVRRLSSILSIPADEISTNKPMIAYGLDSLVAIEIRNWLAREMQANVPMLKLLGGRSLGVLARDIVKMSKLVGASVVDTTTGGEEGVVVVTK